MLCKEIYAAVLPISLILIAWQTRDLAFASISILMASAYSVYRIWIIGPTLTYGDMPYLTTKNYLRFLLKLPYTATSNYGGYLLYGVTVLACWYCIRNRSLRVRLIVSVLGLFAISVASIVPVSYPLYGTIRRPDAWYRIVFLPNTILVLLAGVTIVRGLSRRSQTAILAATLAFVGLGAVKTQQLWSPMVISAELEGRFYIDNPDKMLLSEQEAWWIIPGVHQLYGVKTGHYILSEDLDKVELQPGMVLWRAHGNSFFPETIRR